MNVKQSLLEPPGTDSSTAEPMPSVRTRPLARRVMHLVRRTHLYLGLFLFPWAILYGVTGFLFNHPAVLSDAPTVHFNRSDAVGTPLEDCPGPHDHALLLLAELNERRKSEMPFQLGQGKAHYSERESFVATVKAGQRAFFVTFEPKSASGTIRETTPRNTSDHEPAPFATGNAEPRRQRGMGMRGPMKHDHAGIKLDDNIVDRLKAAVPVIMKHKGFPEGEVTVTTSPSIKFPIEADGRLWTASYNPLTTSVSGTPGAEESELTARAFLLRLHLSRGYPGEVNVKWFWACGVDAMSIILCFWGVSGLFMWWQIKATRWPGLMVLLASALAATSIGVGMHSLLSQ